MNGNDKDDEDDGVDDSDDDDIDDDDEFLLECWRQKCSFKSKLH